MSTVDSTLKRGIRTLARLTSFEWLNQFTACSHFRSHVRS
jgi:hypothetical protein